jgi:hypothetical protein
MTESTGVDTFAKLTLDVEFLSEDRARVEVYYLKEVYMGTLYYEKPKRGWTNKPITPTMWACVDAKVEGLYSVDEGITPKDIVRMGQERINTLQREQHKGGEELRG